MAQPNNNATATTNAKADGSASLDQRHNSLFGEKMESTLRKAREKVKEVQQDVDTDNFDKAWERVYGNKQYRPSWIGKLQSRAPPTRTKHVKAKKPEPVEEEKKEKDEERLPSQTDGIPEQFRNKNAFDPLKIKGKIVPTEQALEKWRNDIDTGEVANNKIVKQTNVTSWIDTNHFWENDKAFLTARPVKKKVTANAPKPTEPQKISTEKYDLVSKYENRVQKDNLKIGNEVVPQEGDLKKWGAGLEIPDDLSDFTVSPTSGRRRKTGEAAGKESEGQKKWNNVLKTADVPNFLAYNGYW